MTLPKIQVEVAIDRLWHVHDADAIRRLLRQTICRARVESFLESVLGVSTRFRPVHEGYRSPTGHGSRSPCLAPPARFLDRLPIPPGDKELRMKLSSPTFRSQGSLWKIPKHIPQKATPDLTGWGLR